MQVQKETEIRNDANDEEIKAIVEENEGLRKGLQEILDFLKDNSKFTATFLLSILPSQIFRYIRVSSYSYYVL